MHKIRARERGPATGVQSCGMPRKILVVDDAEDVRHWLRLTLEARGWEVADADCGEQALKLFDADGAPSLIVLDHMMPGLSGIEVAEELRARGYDRPIVLFSAYLSASMSADLRRLGLVSVSKVDHTALFRVIDAAATAPADPGPGGTST